MVLGAFDIKYMPQTSIKGQVLTDLIEEFAEPPIEIVTEEKKHGWKIGWHNLHARTLMLECVC